MIAQWIFFIALMSTFIRASKQDEVKFIIRDMMNMTPDGSCTKLEFCLELPVHIMMTPEKDTSMLAISNLFRVSLKIKKARISVRKGCRF